MTPLATPRRIRRHRKLGAAIAVVALATIGTADAATMFGLSQDGEASHESSGTDRATSPFAGFFDDVLDVDRILPPSVLDDIASRLGDAPAAASDPVRSLLDGSPLTDTATSGAPADGDAIAPEGESTDDVPPLDPIPPGPSPVDPEPSDHDDRQPPSAEPPDVSPPPTTLPELDHLDPDRLPLDPPNLGDTLEDVVEPVTRIVTDVADQTDELTEPLDCALSTEPDTTLDTADCQLDPAPLVTAPSAPAPTAPAPAPATPLAILSDPVEQPTGDTAVTTEPVVTITEGLL